MSNSEPFYLGWEELNDQLDQMVDVMFSHLTSQFMLLPKGPSFIEYSSFRAGYEALRMKSNGFTALTIESCWDALREESLAFIVLRTILGVSPPEWQDLATQETGAEFSNNFARTLERKIKDDGAYFTNHRRKPTTEFRVNKLLETAIDVIASGAEQSEEVIHRLEKIDTRDGLTSLHFVAQHDVPYAVLLYERYLGRPYASHRDAVSELVGDVMENAIEKRLDRASIPHRKTGRAERVPGFDQAPDFFVPDELAPAAIIEAKITGDDGTARDKVARILRLAGMRDQLEREGKDAFELIACIDGRGFGVRRQDMKDLLLATRGKLFTAATLDHLVDSTILSRFVPESH